MFFFSRSPFFALLSLLVFGADAHICLLSPPQRGVSVNDTKLEPGDPRCSLRDLGGCFAKPSISSPAKVYAGSNLQVKIQQNMNHFSGSMNGYMSAYFVDPTTGVRLSDEVKIDDYPAYDPFVSTDFEIDIPITRSQSPGYYVLAVEYDTNNTAVADPTGSTSFFQCSDVIVESLPGDDVRHSAISSDVKVDVVSRKSRRTASKGNAVQGADWSPISRCTWEKGFMAFFSLSDDAVSISSARSADKTSDDGPFDRTNFSWWYDPVFNRSLFTTPPQYNNGNSDPPQGSHVLDFTLGVAVNANYMTKKCKIFGGLGEMYPFGAGSFRNMVTTMYEKCSDPSNGCAQFTLMNESNGFKWVVWTAGDNPNPWDLLQCQPATRSPPFEASISADIEGMTWPENDKSFDLPQFCEPSIAFVDESVSEETVHKIKAKYF